MSKKPEIRIDLATDLTEGHAECFDKNNQFIGTVVFPTKPPLETRRVRVPPETYFSLFPAARVLP